jgi:hypothetical protein
MEFLPAHQDNGEHPLLDSMTLIVIFVLLVPFVQAVQPFLLDALLVKDLILPQLHVLFKLHAILAII